MSNLSIILVLLMGIGWAYDSYSTPKKVEEVGMCFGPYTVDTSGPVTGVSLTGFPCDENSAPILSAPPIGTFSTLTTPPTCTPRILNGTTGTYEALVSAFVTMGNSKVAYNFLRTTKIEGTAPCLDSEGKPTGTCTCVLEPEEIVITGIKGTWKEKMIENIDFGIVFDPITHVRVGAKLTVFYNKKGPNIGYL